MDDTLQTLANHDIKEHPNIKQNINFSNIVESVLHLMKKRKKIVFQIVQ